MFTLRQICPHCAREVNFRLYSISEYRHRLPAPAGAVNSGPSVQVRSYSQDTPVEAYGVSTCPECESPILVRFSCGYGQLQLCKTSGTQSEWRYSGEPPKIIDTFPRPQMPDDSPWYPDEIREIFIELQEDVQRDRSPARIIVGCRSVMEVALRKLGYEKGNLLSRIEMARNDGILTESMKDWAHRVRINGNEAVHELSASHEQAKELVAYIRLFLEIAFVLPKRVDSEMSKNPVA